MNLEELNNQFVELGWVKIQFADPDPIHEVRDRVLDFLRRTALPKLERLQDYHRFVDDDRHTEIQYAVAEFYWKSGLGPQIISKNTVFFRSLIGLDLHIQKYPYLRIARPSKHQDNIGFHRDTHYGATPYEISVFIPFVDLVKENSLAFIFGSHVEPDSAYPYTQYEDTEVPKGSKKHQLGQLYAPKRFDPPVNNRVTPIPVNVGEALVFSLSIVHGQHVNSSNYTRFSTDIRVVNSLAPIQWERNVHSDYYRPLCTSAVTKQAQMYRDADATSTNNKRD